MTDDPDRSPGERVAEPVTDLIDPGAWGQGEDDLPDATDEV